MLVNFLHYHDPHSHVVLVIRDKAIKKLLDLNLFNYVGRLELMLYVDVLGLLSVVEDRTFNSNCNCTGAITCNYLFPNIIHYWSQTM